MGVGLRGGAKDVLRVKELLGANCGHFCYIIVFQNKIRFSCIGKLDCLKIDNSKI